MGLILEPPREEANMVTYLHSSVVLDVKKFIKRNGALALYESVNVGGKSVPRHIKELGLVRWEIKSILVHLGYDPTNPGKGIIK